MRAPSPERNAISPLGLLTVGPYMYLLFLNIRRSCALPLQDVDIDGDEIANEDDNDDDNDNIPDWRDK